MAAPVDPSSRSKRSSAAQGDKSEAWPLLIGFVGLAFFPVMAVAISLSGLRDPPPADRRPTREPAARQAAIVADPSVSSAQATSEQAPMARPVPRASLRTDKHDVLQTLSANPSMDLCLQLARLGFANEGWRETGAGGWECLSADEGSEEGAVGNSVFFVLRGEIAGQLSSAFVKINVHEPGDRKAVLDRTTVLLTEIGFAFASAMPASLVEAVSEAKEREKRISAVSYKFTREPGPVERYNLRLWRRTLAPLPQDADLNDELISGKI